MRCNNCGWGNNPQAVRCEKCNVPLGSMLGDQQSSRQNKPSDNKSELAGTIQGARPDLPYLDMENQAFVQVKKQESSEKHCVHCGYPMMPQAKKCLKCSKAIEEEQDEYPLEKNVVARNIVKGTINPYNTPQNHRFSLKPIPRQGESSLNVVQFFSMKEDLSRDNLEANNMSITSKTQAVIMYENGKWFIQDKSTLQTTFVQTKEPIELRKGDIIMMGDRKFEFDF